MCSCTPCTPASAGPDTEVGLFISGHLASSTLKLEYIHNFCYIFCRYNCSIDEILKGKVLIFPGELTHMFTSQPVTKGTFSFLTLKTDFGNHIMFEKHGISESPGFVRISNENDKVEP